MRSRSQLASRRRERAAAGALGLGLMLALQGTVCSLAAAHGPAPSAVAIVDEDGAGPKVIRLTGGYARRVDSSRYQFLCPAAWGDDVVLPAAAIPDGPVVIAAGRGLHLVDAAGLVTRHPDPMAASPATDFARLGGKLYVLRTSGANSEVLEVDATRVRLVFTDPGSWTSIAATSSSMGLQRLTDTHIEQVRITADGTVLGRESAPSPKDPILVTARATTQELYSVVATAVGRELGQVVGDEWKRIELASSSIAGPVEVPNGDSFIAVDSALVRLPEPQVLLEGMPPVSCLGRLGDNAYACTRDGVSALAPAGVGEPIFELSSMSPPDLTTVAIEQQSLCTSQWEHFRFDLLALGVTLIDPPVTTADAGPPTAAGTGGVGLALAGSPASTAGVAGSIAMPPAREADGGCSVIAVLGTRSSRAERAGDAPLAIAPWLASVVGVLVIVTRGRARARRRRVRARAPDFLVFLLGAVAAALAGCDRGAESRAEARALLDRLNKLSANGTLAQRKQAIDALGLISVRVPEHAHALELCRTAHLQLLQAEAAQVSARKALEEATRNRDPGGAPIAPERGQAIAAELQQSNAALATAKREFPKCEKATLELTREAR